MIGLMFTGMCEGCKRAELELHKIPCSFGDSAEDKWSIYCTHQYACERVANWTRRLVESREEKGEDK